MPLEGRGERHLVHGGRHGAPRQRRGSTTSEWPDCPKTGRQGSRAASKPRRRCGTATPLWSVCARRDPFQEIGLHGGLTHLIWTDPRATRGGG